MVDGPALLLALGGVGGAMHGVRALVPTAPAPPAGLFVVLCRWRAEYQVDTILEDFDFHVGALWVGCLVRAGVGAWILQCWRAAALFFAGSTRAAGCALPPRRGPPAPLRALVPACRSGTPS